ncbi:hypothetical protein D9M71_753240 [compost metagenome]
MAQALGDALVDPPQLLVGLAQAVQRPVGGQSAHGAQVLAEQVGTDGAEQGFVVIAERLVEPGHGPEEIGMRAAARRPYGAQHGADGALQRGVLADVSVAVKHLHIHFAVREPLAEQAHGYLEGGGEGTV